MSVVYLCVCVHLHECMCGLASCSLNCLQSLLLQFSTCGVSVQMFSSSTVCKTPFLRLTLSLVCCTEGCASKSNLEIYTLQTFHDWIFVNIKETSRRGKHQLLFTSFNRCVNTHLYSKFVCVRVGMCVHVFACVSSYQ